MPDVSLAIHGRMSSVFMLTGIGVGPFFLIWLFAGLSQPHPWLILTIMIFVCIAIYVWIRAFKVTIKNGVLDYHSLLRGHERIELNHIKTAKMELFGTREWGKWFYPPIRLSIYPRDDRISPIRINLKVFSRADVTELMNIVER